MPESRSDSSRTSLSLTSYLKVVGRRWRLIVCALIVGVLASSAYVIASPKVYEANVQIFVSTAVTGTGTAADLAQGNSFTQARVQSYTSVANSQAVTQAVITQLGLTIPATTLAKQISADAPLNKVLVNLHVHDGDPVVAARIANAVATQFSAAVELLEQTAAAIQSPIRLTVTHPARVPTTPISPRTKLDIGIGVLIGLVVGLGLAFLREALDNTIRDRDELEEEVGLAVLGSVPWDKQIAATPISFRGDAHGGRAESFRQLRVNLEFIEVDNPPRVIAVTSALAGEGKTHTALNLAAALAEVGRRVCLVEADLRRPTLAGLVGVVGEIGLTSVLGGIALVDDVLQYAGDNLTVLTAGPVPPNPSELLNTHTFRLVLAGLRDRFDMVIIDTAPLLPVADGALVAALADAAVLTVRGAKTHRVQVHQAISTLAHVGVTPAGVILSMAPPGHGARYGHYYGEYRPDRASPREGLVRAG